MKSYTPHKKLLFCASFIPPVNAGAGKNAFNFASYLANESNSVTILTLNRRGKLIIQPTDSDLKIRSILYLNHNLILKILSLLIIVPGYFYYVAKNEVIFIYGGNIIGFEFLILFGKLLGKKVVFRSTMLMYDDASTLIKERFGGRVRKLALGTLSIYFSINKAFTERWQEQLPGYINIFESVHGVDAGTFNPVSEVGKQKLRQKLNLPLDIPIIISVGYLIKRKGFHQIFDILADIKDPFHYVIIGDHEVHKDHYMAGYNREMKELHALGYDRLQGKISIKGPKENVVEYLRAADIFILGSGREGFPPNALMEAMACGLPCVVKEIPGIDNKLTRKGENLLAGAEHDSLIKIVSGLLRDSETRYKVGRSAFQAIQDRGSFYAVWNALIKLL